jgi:hypothetical protein
MVSELDLWNGTTTIPAYSKDEFGNFVYNPNNSAGIPNTANLPVKGQLSPSATGMARNAPESILQNIKQQPLGNDSTSWQPAAPLIDQKIYKNAPLDKYRTLGFSTNTDFDNLAKNLPNGWKTITDQQYAPNEDTSNRQNRGYDVQDPDGSVWSLFRMPNGMVRLNLVKSSNKPVFKYASSPSPSSPGGGGTTDWDNPMTTLQKQMQQNQTNLKGKVNTEYNNPLNMVNRTPLQAGMQSIQPALEPSNIWSKQAMAAITQPIRGKGIESTGISSYLPSGEQGKQYAQWGGKEIPLPWTSPFTGKQAQVNVKDIGEALVPNPIDIVPFGKGGTIAAKEAGKLARNVAKEVSPIARELVTSEVGAIGGNVNKLKIVPEVLKAKANSIGLDVEAIEGIAQGEHWVAITGVPSFANKSEVVINNYIKWFGNLPKETEKIVRDTIAKGGRSGWYPESGKLFLPFKTLEDANKFIDTGDASLIAKQINLKGEAWKPSTVKSVQKIIDKQDARLKPLKDKINAIDSKMNQIKADNPNKYFSDMTPPDKTASQIEKEFWKLVEEKQPLLKQLSETRLTTKSSVPFEPSKVRPQSRPGTGKVVPQKITGDEGNVIFESFINDEPLPKIPVNEVKPPLEANRPPIVETTEIPKSKQTPPVSEQVLGDVNKPPVEPPILATNPDDVVKRFTDAINDPKNLKIVEADKALKTQQTGQRFRAFRDILPDNPTEADVIKATGQLKSKFQRVQMKLDDLFTPEERKVLFDKVDVAFPDKSNPEYLSHFTALQKALDEGIITDVAGGKGGSQRTRLEDVFGKPFVDSLKKASEKVKTHNLTEPEQLDPNVLNYIREMGGEGRQAGLETGGIPYGGKSKPTIPELPSDQLPLRPMETPLVPNAEQLPGTLNPTFDGKYVNSLKPGVRVQLAKALHSLGINAIDALGIPKAVKFSLDFSYMMRQLGISGTRHPITWLKTWKPYFKAMRSDEVANKLNNEILDPAGQWAVDRLGLDPYILTDAKSWTQRPETLASKIANKYIPGVGASNRGAAVASNYFMVNVGKTAEKALSKMGVTPDEYKAMGALINQLCGRGTLPNALKGTAGDVLNKLLTSPRYLVSRFQWPTKMFSSSKAVRQEAISTMGTWLAMGSGIMTLAMLAGKPAELDPRSPDAYKIVVGGKHIDIWVGYAQIARLFAQMAPYVDKKGNVDWTKGSKKMADGTIAPVNRSDVLARFAQSKTSPGVGAITSFITGKNYVGEPLTGDWKGIGKFAEDTLAPATLDEIATAYFQEGVGSAALSAIGIPGIGVSTYPGSYELIKQWKPEIDTFNSLPATEIELRQAQKTNPDQISRQEYRKQNPDIEAKLFITGSGGVDSVSTWRGALAAYQMIQSNKVDANQISSVQTKVAENKKLTDAQLENKSITPMNTLVNILTSEGDTSALLKDLNNMVLAESLKKQVASYDPEKADAIKITQTSEQQLEDIKTLNDTESRFQQIPGISGMGITLGEVDKKFSGIDLNPQEKNDYQRSMGDYVTTQVQQLMSQPIAMSETESLRYGTNNYQELSTTQQRGLIESRITQLRDGAKDNYILTSDVTQPKEGDTPEQTAQRKELGLAKTWLGITKAIQNENVRNIVTKAMRTNNPDLDAAIYFYDSSRQPITDAGNANVYSYRKGNYKETLTPVNVAQAQQIQKIIEPYYRIEDFMWQRIPAGSKDAASKIEEYKQTGDIKKALELYRKYPMALNARKMIAKFKLRLRKSNQLMDAIITRYS